MPPRKKQKTAHEAAALVEINGQRRHTTQTTQPEREQPLRKSTRRRNQIERFGQDPEQSHTQNSTRPQRGSGAPSRKRGRPPKTGPNPNLIQRVPTPPVEKKKALKKGNRPPKNSEPPRRRRPPQPSKQETSEKRYQNPGNRKSRKQRKSRSETTEVRRHQQNPAAKVRGKAVARDSNTSGSIADWIETLEEASQPPVESISSQSTSTNARDIKRTYEFFGYMPPKKKSKQENGTTLEDETTYSGKKPSADTNFKNGLLARQVEFTPNQDPLQEKFEAYCSGPLVLFDGPNDASEEEWAFDLDRSKRAIEAVFQRTNMMNMFNRFKLDSKLAWTCESAWGCCPFPRPWPTMDDPTLPPYRNSSPKPDAAFAFDADSIFDGNQSDSLELRELRPYLFPESYAPDKNDRAFYFFTIEVKRTEDSGGISAAEYQNLNSASIALHSMYRIMAFVGREQEFFDSVRFISAAATSDRIVFRVHRAEPHPSGSQHPNRSGLRFRHYVLKTLPKDEPYTLANVQRTTAGLLYSYGVRNLFERLRSATQAVVERKRAEAILTGQQIAAQAASAPSSTRSKRGRKASQAASRSVDSARNRLGAAEIAVSQ